MDDPWPRMTRLERDIVLIVAGVVTASSAVGAALGWLGHQVFQHLHHEGRSEHFQGSR